MYSPFVHVGCAMQLPALDCVLYVLEPQASHSRSESNDGSVFTFWPGLQVLHTQSLPQETKYLLLPVSGVNLDARSNGHSVPVCFTGAVNSLQHCTQELHIGKADLGRKAASSNVLSLKRCACVSGHVQVAPGMVLPLTHLSSSCSPHSKPAIRTQSSNGWGSEDKVSIYNI